MEAHFEYLRALRAFQDASNQERWLNAIEHFERAVELDPEFGRAWAFLSIYRAMSVTNALYPPEEREAMIEQSRREASQAVELAPNDALTRLIPGYQAYHFRRDYDTAHEIFSEVLAANRDPAVEVFLVKPMAAIQRRRGEFEESLAYWERAMELDPLDAEAADGAAMTYLAVRDHERSGQILDRMIAQSPDKPILFLNRAWVELKETGSLERTRALFEQTGVPEAGMPELSRYERDCPPTSRPWPRSSPTGTPAPRGCGTC